MRAHSNKWFVTNKQTFWEAINVRKKWSTAIVAVMAVALISSGCSTRTTNDNNNGMGARNVRQQANNLDYPIMDNTSYDGHMMGRDTATTPKARMNNQGAHQNSKMEMSEDAAKRINAMNNVDAAYVMMTDNNAYVAVKLQGNNKNADIPADLKNKIAQEVKKTNGNVDNVYVSVNPDFVGTMEGYMNDVRAGHPIKGMVSEFNAMVERIFPTQAAK